MTAPPDRSCSRGTRTRRTRSASAAPTRRGRCSSTATRTRRTAASPSSRARSRAHGRTSTLIAGANGIADPLDPRVVEAYWVGNELLDRVGRADARAARRGPLPRPASGGAGEHVVDAVAAGAVPHHCFHVFAVYPWLGLLRTGIVDEPLHVLDQCRTTPALVARGRRRLGRRCSRGRSGSGTATLGSARRRRASVRWRDDGLAFVPAPQPGDLRLAALGLRLRRALPGGRSCARAGEAPRAGRGGLARLS